MSEKLQMNNSEVEKRFTKIMDVEFGAVALNDVVREKQSTPVELDAESITDVEVVKHSSKAASRAKAFASISGSGCTDE